MSEWQLRPNDQRAEPLAIQSTNRSVRHTPRSQHHRPYQQRNARYDGNIVSGSPGDHAEAACADGLADCEQQEGQTQADIRRRVV